MFCSSGDLKILYLVVDSYIRRWNSFVYFKILRSVIEIGAIMCPYEAFHVNSPSVAQNSAVFGSCSN